MTMGESVAAEAAVARGAGYKAFVVGIILLANVLSYADRSILSVLAEPIKRDMGISDAQIGFLFGTSFILFLALAGLAAARLSDGWMRNRLLAIGILCWSALTTLSGFANSFAQLAVARFGVGLSEATMSPVGHSLLADLFPPRQRGKIFAIYLSGPFLGSALCIALAGWLLGAWPRVCGGLDLCEVRGWQAAFFLFGLPGVLVGLLVLAIGEPVDRERRRNGHPIRDGLDELGMIVPPFPLFRFGSARLVVRNLVTAAAIAVLAGVGIAATGDIAQWVAVGVGAYAAASWAQGLARREPELYRRTIGSRAYMLLVAAMCVPAIIAASVSFWTVPLALRTFGLQPHEAGVRLGLAVGGGALVGTLVGGWLGDLLRPRTPLAAIWITVVALGGSALSMAGLLTAPDIGRYALILTAASAFGGLWSAPNAALVQELVTTEIRSRGAVIFSLGLGLVAMSFGPYMVGRIADALGSLKLGLGLLYLLLLPFAILVIAAARAIPGAIVERAAPEPMRA